MSSGSIHNKLDRIRKPRVQIRYDVESYDSTEGTELPFVVGVMGDFSGNPAKPLEPIKDRKFVNIDRDNFNEVMQRFTPALNFRVENTLDGDGSELALQLKFNSIEDFEPGRVVDQVEPLRKLLEQRNELRDLLTKMNISQKLEPEIEELLRNTERMQSLAKELGLDSDKGGDA